ncbi:MULTISPECIES: PTS sugar transporter subunit IIA [Cryobacterium]|uniref:Mannitol-specific phosphotransferase enzyme IIA component n=1 Tax=Cryobacterium zongtaii TaxID=1259217 RepID=A0A2S3ZMV7_9MICO|nr:MULTISPECIES: PTS sugar transporter subunit IIA [Cryobacterium]ASD23113.1 PTS mannitol transporter subunit IIA [Cryobacterium sp. LW097]MEC5184499.1 PTS system mannitol-specific IIA component [Cryobacterium sp. MP_3.1]POH68531.1 PTS mannitol transporter subunit IIA [Cryobacterium zongtaii]POH70148.1 PTS mannitol transporter subunit IIA [Cryobacterium zongtaii]POH70938.1 PTS mannitol transporter subunit IIA [Cryobacterium zongtaii]
MTQSILEPQNVVAAGAATTRDEAIREAGALLVAAGAVKQEYVDSMFERENSVSTYMGNFLAIPHGTNDAKESIVRSALSLVRYAEPIDWDGQPVKFAVGIAGLNNEHLEILSKIAVVFSDEDEVQKLIDAGSQDEIFALLEEVNAE